MIKDEGKHSICLRWWIHGFASRGGGGGECLGFYRRALAWRGEWSCSNIRNLLGMLRCFESAQCSFYMAMCTCPPRFFESAQCSFYMALHSALERIVTAFGPGFGDWKWRLATLPLAFVGLGVYCACDVLKYAFRAS
nr:putative reverse transcriptase domain-containing protein [Tanacetum cinerariifolium]